MSQKGPTGINRFIASGLAGSLATCFVQPIDLIKTRMQLSGEGGKSRVHKTAFHAFWNILKTEGIFNLYNGLSAGIFRQATYTTTRLGVFQYLQDNYSGTSKDIGVVKRLMFGSIAGAVGAFIGTPAEITLIRMTADGSLPVNERRGYRHVFHALSEIVLKEGILTLWRGVIPTMLRATILNAAQLGGYSQAKAELLKRGYKDGKKVHFIASMFAGLLCTIVSLPVDITKTRLQNMRKVNGVPQYSGVINCVVEVVKKEGFFSLWKGFTPYFLRLGPHTILTFIFLEEINKRMITWEKVH